MGGGAEGKAGEGAEAGRTNKFYFHETSPLL